MENQENRNIFQPMTLANLLLILHKTYLNLLDYERKPPDGPSVDATRQIVPEKDGDPA